MTAFSIFCGLHEIQIEYLRSNFQGMYDQEFQQVEKTYLNTSILGSSTPRLFAHEMIPQYLRVVIVIFFFFSQIEKWIN